MSREDKVRLVAESIVKLVSAYSNNATLQRMGPLAGSVGQIAAWLSQKYGDQVVDLFKSGYSANDIASKLLKDMSQEDIEPKVKQIIVDELGVDINEVTPNARFIDDLGADSLDTVELVMRFEEEFGIEIPDEDAEKMQSVRDVYAYISQRANQ